MKLSRQEMIEELIKELGDDVQALLGAPFVLAPMTDDEIEETYLSLLSSRE